MQVFRIMSIMFLTLAPLSAIAERMTVMDAMKMQMDYSNQRQVVLSKNMANSDTPGYQAKDLKPLNFKRKLSKSLGMTVTSSSHIAGSKSVDSFKTLKDKHTFETTPTGNSVVIEDQVMKMSENSTDYQATTNLYKKMVGMMKTSLGTR